ncbi:hypothetical protein Tco_0887723 [Tanacetum coccineum]
MTEPKRIPGGGDDEGDAGMVDKDGDGEGGEEIKVVASVVMMLKVVMVARRGVASRFSEEVIELYFSDTLPLHLCRTSIDAVDSRPGSSFDGSASSEYDSGLGRASLTRVLGLFVSSGSSEGYYTPHPAKAVVSELPNDMIAIYHRMFGFSGVRILFSSFLLSVIKHFKIKQIITPFKLFQTLCKFSFTKCRAPAPVCMDDNRSCMKDWKTAFFYVDQRAILDSMP